MMKHLNNIRNIFFVILLFSLANAQTDSSFAIRMNRLSYRVAVASGSQYNTNQIIIQTRQGLILIDTGISPKYGRELRQAIKNEFKRNDYIYVINTHHHWDHVQGNQVFDQTTIVAHQNCAARINDAIIQRENFHPQPNRHVSETGEETVTSIRTNRINRDSLPPPAPPGQVNPNLSPPPPYILYDDSFFLTPPDLSFSDRMTLHLKEITVHLIYYSKAHTDNDIIIYIPEEKLVAVGDLFFKHSLPKFIEDENPHVERWIETLHWLIEKDEIDYVVSGHNELLMRTDMEINLNYIETMWVGIGEAFNEGASLAEIQSRFALVNKFPRLQKWDLKDQNGVSLHQKNVEAIYKLYEKHK